VSQSPFETPHTETEEALEGEGAVAGRSAYGSGYGVDPYGADPGDDTGSGTDALGGTDDASSGYLDGAVPSASEQEAAGDVDVEHPGEPDSVEEQGEEPVAEEPVVEEDPVAAFYAELRRAPGDWYVINSYAGYENRVKANLEQRTATLNMEDFIFQVEVPMEEVNEIKNGQRKTVRRTKFPGYVLVRMDLTDESWGVVRNTPGVTQFVGHAHNPSPLSIDEVGRMLAPKPEEKKGAGAAAASQEVHVVDFAVGDSAMVTEGPFATLHATINEIDVDARKVRGLVEIFGRETPVELPFSQIQKI